MCSPLCPPGLELCLEHSGWENGWLADGWTDRWGGCTDGGPRGGAVGTVCERNPDGCGQEAGGACPVEAWEAPLRKSGAQEESAVAAKESRQGAGRCPLSWCTGRRGPGA